MEEIHFENGFKYIGTRDSKGVMQKHGVLSNEGVKKVARNAKKWQDKELMQVCLE